MGKKQQREERRVSIQGARRLSGGSGSATLTTRPTGPVTIGEIVESNHDEALEQHLPDIPSSTSNSFFGTILVDSEEEGPVVVSPVLEKSREDSERLEQGPDTISTSSSTEERYKAKRWAYKNVFGLSLAYVVLFTAFSGLQNLQSSINSAGGLGLTTLSLLYAMFIAAGFVAPSILKLLGTKYSLLFGFLCHLIYTLANYYPSWYTLVPGSILIGFASAPLWAAASTHLAEVAVIVAPSLRKKQDYLISKFTAIFFCIFQFSQVPGNLASSLILFPYSEGDLISSSSLAITDRNLSSNYSIEYGDEWVCHDLESTPFDLKYLYILVSVYVMFIVAGIVLLLVFVDRLPTNNKFLSAEKKFQLYLKNPLVDLLKVLKDVKMLLIAPVVVVNGLELAFVFGSFTEHYISQCSGTYMVGFVLIVFGLSSALWSYVYGKCLKYIPRFLILLFGAFLSTSTILFMLFWEREPNLIVFFILSAVLGAADAVWNTTPASLTGILFSHCSDVAYSAMRIWQAVGFTIGFALAEFFTFQGRLWVLLSTVILAAITALIVEFTTQKREDLFPCVYRRHHRRSKSCDGGESGDTSTTSSGGSYSPDLDKKNELTTVQLTSEHNNVGQNPIFIMYQGRRPSAMSMMSTYSNDGLNDAVTAITDTVLPNGQNPLFVMHQGRRPSAISTYSVDSLDGTMPSMSTTSDLRVLVPVVGKKYFDMQKGRIPSDDSLVRGSVNRKESVVSISRDSLDGTLPSLGSNTSVQCYPPLTITTVACANVDSVRALSPIRESEDNEEEHPRSVIESRKVSIQRSDSYVAALNNTTNIGNAEISQC